MILRLFESIVKKQFWQGKVIVLTGARQVGKSTLVEMMLSDTKSTEIKRFNADDPQDRELLTNRSLPFLQNLVGDARIVVIDEGQKVSTIGQTLKLMVDHYRDQKQIIVTGSSSFRLLDSTQEALTGRKFTHTLYPLSLAELYPGRDVLQMTRDLESLIIYGSYPDVITQKSYADKETRLRELTSSYLYQDILEFQQIKNPELLRSLLKALALQIGSEVSYTELSNLLGIDKNTVERYVDLLEKNYVIFRLSPWARNKRKEISKLRKIYFYDNGIRNSILGSFNLLDSRNDTGALWENWMMVERLKYRTYKGIYRDMYFWRSYRQEEVDLVEEQGDRLQGFEFKWKATKSSKPPSGWVGYGGSYEVVTAETFPAFLFG